MFELSDFYGYCQENGVDVMVAPNRVQPSGIGMITQFFWTLQKSPPHGCCAASATTN